MSIQHKHVVYYRVNPGETGIGGTDIDFWFITAEDELEAAKKFKVAHPALQVLDVYEVSADLF